jgi:hypothetical protein
MGLPILGFLDDAIGNAFRHMGRVEALDYKVEQNGPHSEPLLDTQREPPKQLFVPNSLPYEDVPTTPQYWGRGIGHNRSPVQWCAGWSFA